jgi:RNA-directed DNA polymerase
VPGRRCLRNLRDCKFFDRVNHDKLMGQIAKRVEDKRLLKLHPGIPQFWGDGERTVSPSVEGTPQVGPSFATAK